jgi:hypothetical protein
MDDNMKISVSDLSVGDWVCAKMAKWDYDDIDITPPMQVVRIDDKEVVLSLRWVEHCAFVDDLRPIEITADVLEKNGFKKNGEYNEWNIGEWDEYPFIGVSLDRQSMRVKHLGCDIFIEGKVVYIHQLQHALRLAGINKEIKL